MKFLYGHQRFIPRFEDFIIFNFSSLGEGMRECNLIPPNNLGAIDEYDFDIKYANYILGNDNVFINFMNIICELYYGHNVYIATVEGMDWSNTLLESLLKLIQQRYGLNATLIQSMEDTYYVSDTEFNPYYGIANFDIDKERYLHLYESYMVSRGKQPVYE